MKLKEIFKKSIALFAVSCITVASCSGLIRINAASYSYGYSHNPKSLSNLVVPTVISKGGCCSISGTMSRPSQAYYNNTKYNWTCGIVVYPISCNSDFSSKMKNRLSCASKEKTLSYSTTSYSLSNLDSSIEFNKLSSGKYGYTVYNRVAGVGANYGLVSECYNGMFVVTGGSLNAKSSGNVVLTDYTVPPATIYKGKPFSLNGNIGITYNYYKNDTNISKITYIRQMTAYITGSNYNCKQEISGFSEKTRIKAMPSQIDTAMKFDSLGRGTYTLKYTLANYASDSNNEPGYPTQILSQTFDVK